MLRIDRYIMFNFMSGLILMMIMLLSLFSFLAFAEALKSVGEGSFVLLDAFNVVALTTPKRLVELLPVTTLLGSLMGVGMMANNQELIIIQASGMSRRRIARPLIVAALGLVGLVLLLQLMVIPVMERKAVQVNSKSLAQTEVGLQEKLQFWTRNNDYLVRVREVQFGHSLSDIEIYRLDASGRVKEVVLAKHADIIEANNWLLTDVLTSELNDVNAKESRQAKMIWPDLLSTKQAATLILPIQALNPVELFRYIGYLQRNKLNTQRYQIIFWQQLSIPFSLVAMAILSLPLLFGSVRHISASQRIVIGGLIGMGFYLVQQLTGNLAGLFGLNAPLTILTPSILLLGIAVYGIYRQK